MLIRKNLFTWLNLSIRWIQYLQCKIILYNNVFILRWFDSGGNNRYTLAIIVRGFNPIGNNSESGLCLTLKVKRVLSYRVWRFYGLLSWSRRNKKKKEKRERETAPAWGGNTSDLLLEVRVYKILLGSNTRVFPSSFFFHEVLIFSDDFYINVNSLMTFCGVGKLSEISLMDIVFLKNGFFFPSLFSWLLAKLYLINFL